MVCGSTRCARRNGAKWICVGAGVAAGFGLLAGLAGAQPGTTEPETPRIVEKVLAPDALAIQQTIDALYDVISGDAGEARDWDRFRGLFAENAQLVAMGRDRTGESVMIRMTPDDYIERAGPVLEERGFHEVEVWSETERYGAVAHVFSTYITRDTVDGPIVQRGINSIQLINVQGEWKCLTVLWQSETDDLPIPAVYLPS